MKKCEEGCRFGDLVIIKTWSETFSKKSPRKEKVCECKCDCNTIVIVKANALRHENKTSCGCKDGRGCRSQCKIGEVYGNLTILKTWSEKFNNHKSKEKVCECKCDCGKTIVVRAKYLRSNHKKSCGCLQYLNNSKHHAWKGHEEISRSVWNNIKRGSKRRGRTIFFDISIDQAWDLFLKQKRKCAISGVEIKFSIKNARYIEAKENSASLDRIDSSKGYTLDNVQWVHKTVNIMKMSLSQEEFITWCRIISNNSVIVP